ncbi:MAG TPA: STAS domain-containing protein [Burkholderiaceae bacterium]|nr:STAS domain-containing protein [Burkholderiaceae bacterium]
MTEAMTNAAPEALIFPDTVTHNEASGCLDLLRSGAQSWHGNDVRIDASALNKFDSSALAVLLQIKREVQSLGKNLTILGLPKQLQELANLYGIQSVLEN